MLASVQEKVSLPSVEEELSVAAAKCRDALAAREFTGLDALIPDAPRDAQGWFELLSRYVPDTSVAAKIMGMRAAIPAELVGHGVKIERYAVLNALSVGALRIGSVSVPNTVKHLYATLCTEIAARERQWESHFDIEHDSERFLDVAQYATLRRFPAGALALTYERLAPIRATLCVHPLALPGYIYQRAFSMPVTKPAIAPHVNYARKGSLILTRSEYERALWLIAKTVEMNPKVKGLNGWSWFYSQTVGEVYPHLAWMRAMFVDGGAYLVDTFPAQPEGYGFAHQNRKRQNLYDQGKFCPRQTAVFWARDFFLDWASRHPELIPDGEEPVRPPRHSTRLRLRPATPSRHAKHNSPITLWDGMAAFDRFGKLKYTALVLALPALILSLAALLISGPWLALLMLPVGGALAFTFQYFFSQ